MSAAMKAAAAQHWPFLDLVRIGAALLVVLGHVRYLYLESYAKIEAPRIIDRILYLISGLQHEGVVLFFVVSGFLVGGGIWLSMLEGRFDALRYFVNRFVRIYIVFVPTLILVFLLDQLGRFFFAGGRLHPDLLETWKNFNVLCHIACLQGISCGAGQNPPLWSLGYEWWLYLVAPPCLALGLAPVGAIWRALGLGILLCTALVLLPATFSWTWGVCWMLGALARLRLARGGIPSVAGLGGIGLVAAVFVASRARLIEPEFGDLLIAAGLALAIAAPAVIAWCPWNAVMKRLADFSFSIYVTHLPVSVFFAEVLHRMGGIPAVAAPSAGTYLAVVATVAVVLAVSYQFSRVTEQFTEPMRGWILGSLPGGRAR